MLQRIKVGNFRSIERCDVELGPITIFFGPTAAGKSSLLYAVLALRNFVLNPTQAIDGLFNLGFQNLGGLEACVFNHDISKELLVGLNYRHSGTQGEYTFGFQKTEAELSLTTPELAMSGKVSLPYGLNQSFTFPYKGDDGDEFTVTWNGITSAVAANAPTAATQARAQALASVLNFSVEALRRVDVAPHKRGFFKPNYTPGATSPTPTSEDEVASIIINDKELPGRISPCAEDIFDRDFRTYTVPGTAIVYFQTTDKKARMPGYLVNDGYGVNQVIYILAKLLRLDVDTLLIEEPEVHLHPTVIRKFARVLCTLVKEERKQLVLTTHSEQFLFSILTCVKERLIAPADVRCYHVTRERKTTVFEEQAVRENGQLEGGLSSFVEAELEDLKNYLSLKP